jgi:hypothetical protein
MSSFYDKYLYNNNSNNSNSNNNKPKNLFNVNLKNDYNASLNDFEKLKISEQYNKLYSNIFDINKKNIDENQINENKKIYNLSIKDLVNNSSKAYIQILNDFSIFFSNENKNKSINQIGLILTKENNLIYIGILILIISFFLWIIDISS